MYVCKIFISLLTKKIISIECSSHTLSYKKYNLIKNKYRTYREFARFMHSLFFLDLMKHKEWLSYCCELIHCIGGTQRLPRLVGPAIAKELMFTARVIDGQEAARIGLVNHCVEQDDSHEAAYKRSLELAREISSQVISTQCYLNLACIHVIGNSIKYCLIFLIN